MISKQPNNFAIFYNNPPSKRMQKQKQLKINSDSGQVRSTWTGGGNLVLIYFARACAYLWLVAIVLMFAYSCECSAQEAQPTPADQSELSEWWDWCMDNSKVIWRVSKKQNAILSKGIALYPCEERLKVPGPPTLTPFGSMSRTKDYLEKYNNSGFAGLNNQGWNYQTFETTGIGEGQWSIQTWGEE